MNYHRTKTLQRYIAEITGQDIKLQELRQDKLQRLPIYLQRSFEFYKTELLGVKIVLVHPLSVDEHTVGSLEKLLDKLNEQLEGKLVLWFKELESYQRKRLAHKKVNFIVEGKQLFLPDLLVDLKEIPNVRHHMQQSESLTPSAQFLVLYYLLHNKRNKRSITNVPLKEIAEITGYSTMAITKAVRLLEHHEIVHVQNDTEKRIDFHLMNAELWSDLLQRNLFINPVYKTVYIEEPINQPFLLNSNESALAAYTNYNWQGMGCLAIDKSAFYALRRGGELPEINEFDGPIKLELWHYSPSALVDDLPTEWGVVDPLSLYLSLRDSNDERIELELEKIIEEYIW